MVAVTLRKSRSGYIYEFAGGDWQAFLFANNGYRWLPASQFEPLKRRLMDWYGVKLTKKWYHVQRLRDVHY